VVTGPVDPFNLNQSVRFGVLKLYGFAVSNYFNMVRMALAAKGIEYEEVTLFPNQEGDWLAKSPMGKVPCLETPEGSLSETAVIIEYLDDAFPEHPLLPGNAFERARIRQMMHVLEKYIELPARRLFPGVFFGGQNADLTIEEVKPVLEKGARSVAALAVMDPYLMGAAPTAADYMAMYSLDLAAAVAKSVYDWDLLADIPGAADLLARLGEDPNAQRFDQEKKAQMAAFLSKARS
jgi:glutathione S-transferase